MGIGDVNRCCGLPPAATSIAPAPPLLHDDLRPYTGPLEHHGRRLLAALAPNGCSTPHTLSLALPTGGWLETLPSPQQDAVRTDLRAAAAAT